MSDSDVQMAELKKSPMSLPTNGVPVTNGVNDANGKDLLSVEESDLEAVSAGSGTKRLGVQLSPLDIDRSSSAGLGGGAGAIARSPISKRLGSESKYQLSPKRGSRLSMYDQGQTEQELREAFVALDASESGRLEKDEVLTALLPSIGVHDMQPDEYDALMHMVDTDNDGTLDFEEFVMFYQMLCNAGDSDGGDKMPKPKTGKQLVETMKESKRKAEEQYLTEKQIAGKLRIQKILYELPCFAPDYVYRRWWDLVVLISIAASVIVPSVVCALALEPTAGRIVVDIAIAIVNILDVAIILNTGFQPEESFVLQVKRWEIARNYWFKGLMIVDIAAAFPLDLIVWAVTKELTAYRVLTLLKAVKLLKIPKLFHMTNRGTMDPSFVRFYFLTVPVITWMFKMIFIMHFLTLTRMIISRSEDYASEEERNATDGWECPLYGRDGCTDDPFLMYFYSLFWVWSLLTTQGTAHLDSFISFFYASFVMFLSLLLQGVVVANMSAIILKSNVEVQNQDAMRGTLAIMRHYKIPALLQQEVLSFQFHSLQQNAAASLAHTLERLPPTMQREVGLYVKVDLVTNVPMFQELQTEAQLSLANCLEQTFAEPYDYIIAFGEKGSSMYFMMHGFADVIIPATGAANSDGLTKLGIGNDMQGRVVATIIRGDFFGEVALLKPELKRTASIQALTYCNLYRLGLEAVMTLFKQYPEIKFRMETEAQSRGLLSNGDDKEKKGDDDDDDEGGDTLLPDGAGLEGNTLTSGQPLGMKEIRSQSVHSEGAALAKALQSEGGEKDDPEEQDDPGADALPGQTPAADRKASVPADQPHRKSVAASSHGSASSGQPLLAAEERPPPPRPGLAKSRSIGAGLTKAPSTSNLIGDTAVARPAPPPRPPGTVDTRAGAGGGGVGQQSIFTIAGGAEQKDKKNWFGFGGQGAPKANDEPKNNPAAVPLPPPQAAAAASAAAPAAPVDPERVKRTVTLLLKSLEGNNDRILRTVHKDMVQYSRRVDDMENKLNEAMSKLTQMATLQNTGNFRPMGGRGDRGSLASLSGGHDMYAPQSSDSVRRTSLRWL